jgi:hypothetical protein
LWQQLIIEGRQSKEKRGRSSPAHTFYSFFISASFDITYFTCSVRYILAAPAAPEIEHGRHGGTGQSY